MPAPKGNRNAKGNRGGPGRTPVYSERLIPIVRTMALYGASDEEIADAIGISRETLRWWRHEHIEFANGTRVTDEEMAEAARTSLFRRAMGRIVAGVLVAPCRPHDSPTSIMNERVTGGSRATLTIASTRSPLQFLAALDARNGIDGHVRQSG
jgi:hypothetical protein